MTAVPSSHTGEPHGVGLDEHVAVLVDEVTKLRRLIDATEHRLRVLEANLEAHLTSDTHGGMQVGTRFPALYRDFTDRFRGSTQEVRAKLRGYLPDARRVVRDGGVVDLGAGRGEWLLLLREIGVPARGVDGNADFVDAGRCRGLAIDLEDGLTYLRRLAADSVDMVTAFHVIEHLAVEELLAIVDAARAVLRPGGCILLETPNPANLTTAACDFYNDPTHRSPLPSALMEYLLTAQGFVDVEVRAVHPKPVPWSIAAGGDDAVVEVRDVVSHVLFGPQDYAILGYKPGG
jgi:O-antigen chain-terminating methyltransferase